MRPRGREDHFNYDSELRMKKTVLITGAAQGLGENLARMYAAHDYRVVGLDLNEARLTALASEIELHPFVVDISVRSSWEAALPQIAEVSGGGLDAVIANAGILKMGSAVSMTDPDWDILVKVNYTGALMTAKMTLPMLERSKGNIVFVGSISSNFAAANDVGYVATKHGLAGIMKSVALDFGPKGVRSNMICPGWMKTPMSNEEMEGIMKKYDCTLDEAYARATTNLPLRRPAEMEEIAEVIRFVSSSQASFLTGVNLTVDGGGSTVDVGMLALDALHADYA
ncbi:SDR family NAD(P)-dependent oxidoreductase [Sphingomonas sp. CLY1604]|uniref:SDR family NAD(P)-dependent oxidoreductase n=1 Tax=Sphingomonas sp. CLY1604 TaxID=3457786 RepID=UPI003FD8B5EC